MFSAVRHPKCQLFLKPYFFSFFHRSSERKMDRGIVRFQLTLLRTKDKRSSTISMGRPDMRLGVKISRVRFWEEAAIAGWAGYASQMPDHRYFRRYSHLTRVTGKARAIRVEESLFFCQLGCLRPRDETHVDNVGNIDKNLHVNSNSILTTLLRAERINFHQVCFIVVSVASH
jgi:hypothetical protein